MSDWLKERLGHIDKKTAIKLSLLFLAGVTLLVISSFMKPKDTKKEEEITSLNAIAVSSQESIEQQLELRLQEALQQVSGAGKVKVMLTLAYTEEKEIAKDEITEYEKTEEISGDSVTRTQESEKREQSTVVLRQKDGSDSPIVLRTAMPKVSGVIIVAEGGGDILIQASLIHAAMAVLDVDAHKVSVLKMK